MTYDWTAKSPAHVVHTLSFNAKPQAARNLNIRDARNSWVESTVEMRLSDFVDSAH